MRLHFGLLVAIITTIALTAVAPYASAADNTFDNVVSQFWDDGQNWSQSTPPDSSDNAIIPVGESCIIRFAGAEAMSFEVYGTLTLNSSTDLTITHGSIVDGLVTVGASADLVIDNNLTIASNDDGVVRLTGGNIVDNGGDEVLTITNTCVNDDPDCSIDIRGFGEVSVELVNDGAVVADVYNVDPGARLYLTTSGKSGSGQWVAEDGGILTVQTTVTGDGLWLISTGDTNSSESVIEIEAGCTCLGGDVWLHDGFFYASESFCTSGDLQYKSSNTGSPSVPLIRVDATETFNAGGSCFCP